MSKHQDSFESALKDAFDNHKRKNALSTMEKRRLRGVFRSGPLWFNVLSWQASAALCGLSLLAFLLLRQHTTPELLPVYRVELTDYHTVEVNEIVDNKYVSTDRLLEIDRARDHALKASRRHHANTGTLLRVNESWYIADCNNRVLVEVKESLLHELGRKNALPKNVRPGEMLALERNPAGEIIALNRVSKAALQCS